MKLNQALHASYLTPEQLWLDFDVVEALKWFVDEVDAGNIRDLPADSHWAGAYCYDTIKTKKPDFFSMSVIAADFSCGTAGCILGHIIHRANLPTSVLDLPKPLAQLFYDRTYNVPVLEARDATVRVLRGDPAWP